MTDRYGRTVTIQTNVNGQDIYSFNGGSVSFPTGTAQSQVLACINSMAPAGWTFPSLPLNQQFTPSQYGQILIDQVTSFNSERSLTDAQVMTFATSFSAYAILLQAGALQTVLDEIPSIPVDGVLVTTMLVATLTGALQAYLGGD